MGAILSSYRRGLGYALSVAWVLRSRGAFALGLSSLSSPRKATTKGGGQGTWQEEEFICQCYYSKNFFVKKVRLLCCAILRLYHMTPNKNT